MTRDPNPEHRGRRIERQIRTTASPAQVWQAWTDPAKISQWFTDGARGEPEVGGTVTWIFEAFGHEIPYRVVHADPEGRYALGGEVPGRGPFLLDVTIAQERGETVVRLVNSGFLDGAEGDDEFASVDSGWQCALALLAHYLENHFGQPKAAELVLRPAAFDYPRLLPLYATAPGLERWLGPVRGLGPGGASYGLTFPDGTAASGRVLAVTRREVALSWDEIGGSLELKAFPMGPGQRMVALRALAWGEGRERVHDRRSTLEGALDRLVAVLAAEPAATAAGG